MRSTELDSRESGIPLLGMLPWGSDFCQFYQTEEDLLDTLVPYFQAGLENNEYCLWITSAPLEPNRAEAALKEAVPDFAQFRRNGQLRIIPRSQWGAQGDRSGKAFSAELDRAVLGGFDGLRLCCHLSSQQSGKSMSWEGAITGHNVIAAFAYPRDRFDALGLMEVVKHHRFALVKDAGRWEVIESSEARTVKDALKRSEEKLQSLFANMLEGFAYHRIVLDSARTPCDYVFLEVNEAFEQLTGLSGKDIIGRRVTQALPGIERDPTDWIGKYGQVALTGQPARFESYSAALQKWFAISAFSPRKGYFAVTFSDITERRRYGEELEEKTRHLEAVNRELESFSYSVSHDLRAPLRAVDAFSQELLEDYMDRLDDNGKDSLQRIRAAAQRMGVLIDGLLKLSRISRNDLKREKVNLSSLAESVASSLAAAHPQRKVTVSISPCVVVEGDEELMYVALQNLMENAWKFTARRSDARIEFGVADATDAPTYFVKDNGAGFDMTYASKLFTPFQRLHHSSEFPGNGIGLATVNRIMQRHGGRIWTESAVGKGAAFYFTLGQTVASSTH